MEFVNGETIEDRVAKRGLPSEDWIVSTSIEILDTLDYLHKRKPTVLYRDMKPSNVMITKDGQIKLIDFGISRYFQPLKTATMIGTTGYAAPEQFSGKVEPRSDLYSLGAMMHYLLSGRDPMQYPPCQFPPLSSIASCSLGVAELVDKALQMSASARFSSAKDFKQALLKSRNAPDPASTTIRLRHTGEVKAYQYSGGQKYFYETLVALVVAGFLIHSCNQEDTSAPGNTTATDTATSIASPITTETASPDATVSESPSPLSAPPPGVTFVPAPTPTPAPSTDADNPYVLVASRENIPREVLIAVAGAESGFHPWALNIAGREVHNIDTCARIVAWAMQRVCSGTLWVWSGAG
ncbi:MAG: serine/threonine protein kinase [Acidobacteria bacterium]|nr:serine/threonine protein kinase [Acidobacteriota bacterium]